jgi:hypothetical protein
LPCLVLSVCVCDERVVLFLVWCCFFRCRNSDLGCALRIGGGKIGSKIEIGKAGRGPGAKKRPLGLFLL